MPTFNNQRVLVCLALLALCATPAVVLADNTLNPGGGDQSFIDMNISIATNSLNAATKLFEETARKISENLVKTALKTCFAALALQWVLTYWKEIFSGDMTSHIAKAVGLISWAMGAVFLIEHTDILSDGFSGYLKLAGSLAGLSADDFNAGVVLAIGKKMITSVHGAIWDASGTSITQIGLMITATIQMILVDLVIIISFGILALTLFVANLEFWMMFAVAPLAFGLIPLSTFRDQGMAPIKGALSLGLRIIILGVCIAVAKAQAAAAISAITTEGIRTGDTPLLACYDYLAGIFGCAIMSISAGKIASAIASGSASFSGSDAIRAGMTAAAGVGIAGAVGGAITKPVTSALGTATSSAKKGISAAKDAFANFGSTGVQKAGGAASGGAGGGNSRAAEAWKSFGGPAVEPRPSAASAESGSGGTQSGGAGNTMSQSAAPASDASASESAGTSAVPSSTSSASSPPASANTTEAPSAPASESAPASASPSKFGGPAVEPRPSAESATSTQPAAGNASTASIGGSSPIPNAAGRAGSGLGGIRSAAGRLADLSAQDSHAVSVQMHVSKD